MRRQKVAKFTVFLGQLDKGDEIEIYAAGGHRIIGNFDEINPLGILQLAIKTGTASHALQIYLDDIIAVKR